MKIFQEELTNKKGFTLLEVMIAILVIMVGTVGVINVLQATTSSVSVSSSRLQAVYLAQEGLEIVRNVRDANWLEARTVPTSWSEGLGTGEWEADYLSQSLFDDYDGDFLNIDANGFYSYSPGTQTGFKRKITVNADPNPLIEKINVRVEVFWTNRGEQLSFSAEENLYNLR